MKLIDEFVMGLKKKIKTTNFFYKKIGGTEADPNLRVACPKPEHAK